MSRMRSICNDIFLHFKTSVVTWFLYVPILSFHVKSFICYLYPGFDVSSSEDI